MNNYEKQAQDFLKKTKTKLEIEFKEFGYMPCDDKTLRNIYSVTLSNNEGQYTFDFGQSTNATKKGIEPTAYDILSCLSPSYSETFEDFCSEFGYNEDSRKAYSTWEAVQEQDAELKALFTPKQLEILLEIQ